MNVVSRYELVHGDGMLVFVYGGLGADARLARRGPETGFGGIHRRLDLLTREWVAIAPARNVRPLDTAEEATGETGVRS